MKKLALAIMATLLMATPAIAAPQACYNVAEERAEHLLRLHSELMVITVTCKQASTGRDLGAAYGAFTQHHLGPIKGAEGTLISHFEKTRSGRGINHLDVLRTRLANDIGQKMADISAPIYCAQKRDLVVQLADSPLPSVSEYAYATYAGVKTTEPTCKGVVRAAELSSQKDADKPVSKGAGKTKNTQPKKSI